MCMNLKCHESVNILSFKHTYQPMRARVVAQLFLIIQSTEAQSSI